MKKFLIPVLALALVSCAVQQPKEEKKVQLIFETDMGNDVDDILALDMCFKYVEDGKADLLAISTNKTDVESLEYLDILKTWYGYPEIPLATVKNNGANCPNIDHPFARRVADMKNPDGTPKYARTHTDYSTIPESCKLYRKILSEAEDTSVVIASTGFTTNLAQLLETGPDEYSDLSGVELVRKKVKLLSLMGGYFANTTTHEFNVSVDASSSKTVFDKWPVKMVLSPGELGFKVMYPGTHIESDFYWGNGEDPLVDGYINYLGNSYDRPCWDLTSVLYAVEGGSMFGITGPGTVSIDAEGATTFTPDQNGLDYVLSVDDAQAEAITKYLVALTHRIPKHFLEKYPYKDPSLTPEQRAADLLLRLTIEQKVALMQNGSPEISELGIRQYNWWSEALHGVCGRGEVTVFPQNTGLAASFDTALVRKCFDIASTEQRASFAEVRKAGEKTEIFRGLTVWAPNLNLFRDPRWGRGQETYGEDPFLIQMMGYAAVNGLQGNTLAPGYDKLHCCLKHYAVHSGPESTRHKADIEDLSYRDLRETYLSSFEYLVKNTDVKEVMCAYNSVDGKPCCGNDRLLTQFLRNEWGYKGIVLSDCWAINNFFDPDGHNIFPDDPVSATANAVMSGTDLECGNSYDPNLAEAVAQGKIDEKKVDESLMRLLTARFELGEMDPEESVSWNSYPSDTLNCAAHHEVSLQMSRESMTLLKNDGVLPLAKTGLKVAVVGPNAAEERVLWGNYNGTPRATVTALDGIISKIGASNVTYCKYCSIAAPAAGRDKTVSTTNADLFSDVNNKIEGAEYASMTKEQLAKEDFDVYIFIGGISSLMEGEEMPVQFEGFYGGDRTTIELPSTQREALAALHATGKPVVFVNMSGSAMGLAPETETCNAILQAWYGGEAGGAAIADVLFGDYNPGGKLPVTFYRCDADIPDFENYDMEGRTYRYFKGTPLFPFGYGLSYTTFSIGDASLLRNGRKVSKFSAADRLELVVPVTNTGKMDGHETVQVYIRRDDDSEGPKYSLRGFDKIDVAAGETVKASISLDSYSFSFFNDANGLIEPVPGSYTIYYGTSSDEKDLKQMKVTLK